MCSISSDALVATVMAVSEVVVESLSALQHHHILLQPWYITCLFLLEIKSAGVIPSMLERLVLPTSIAVSTLMVLWACTPVQMFHKMGPEEKDSFIEGNSEVSGCLSNYVLALIVPNLCSVPRNWKVH